MDQNNPHNYMGSLMLARSCDVMHALPAQVAPRKQHNEECSLVIGIMTSNIGPVSILSSLTLPDGRMHSRDCPVSCSCYRCVGKGLQS